MSFEFAWENRENSFGIDGRVAVLQGEGNRLEVWPALGFNAYRWQSASLELLYRNPNFFTEKLPMRSGFPILFPFPNRIRDGKFTWAGKTYELPIGDPAKKNAIHGFAFNCPWRVLGHGANASGAWITAEFHGSQDAPETLALWPSDYRLRITYRLFDRVLRVEAEVDNPGTQPLPWGIGYHPYFTVAPFGGPAAVVTAAAAKYWELRENLPTGQVLDVDYARELRHGQFFANLNLDDLYTNIYDLTYDQEDRIGMIAVLQHPSGEKMLTLWVSEGFRELIGFTPPHREAICLEPYTCITDAINLQQQKVEAGLHVLMPGERWTGVVEMHLAST